MRKTAGILAAVPLSLSLAACGGSSEPEVPASSAPANLEVQCLEPSIEGDPDTGALARFDLEVGPDKSEVVERAREQTAEALAAAIADCPDYTFAAVTAYADTSSQDDKSVVYLLWDRATLEDGIPAPADLWESADESTIHDDLRQ